MTLELVLMIDKRLRYNGFETALTRADDKSPGDASDRGKFFAKNKVDFGLSIHFNAFSDASANGTECYVPYGEKYGYAEKEIMQGFKEYFKLREPVCRSKNLNNQNEITDKQLSFNTGLFGTVIKEKYDYFGVIRNAWGCGVSADLLEVCFATSKKDMDIYIKNKEKIADIIAGGIVRAYGGIYQKFPKAPSYKELYETEKAQKEKLINEINGVIKKYGG